MSLNEEGFLGFFLYCSFLLDLKQLFSVTMTCLKTHYRLSHRYHSPYRSQRHSP